MAATPATFRAGRDWRATAAPTVDNDSTLQFGVTDRWTDEAAGKTYVCWGSTPGAAQWVETDGTGGGGGGGGTTLAVNGVATASALNLNDSTPAGSASHLNVKWQLAGGGFSASAYVPIDNVTLVVSGGNLTADFSGLQPLDADLTALAALGGTGFADRTGPGTWTLITISGTSPINFSGGVISVDDASTSGKGVVRLATPSTDTTAGRVVQAQDTRVNYPSFPRTLTEDLALNPDRSVVVLGPLDLATFTLDLGTSVLMIL
jgi:hypothetical protein